MSHFDFKKFRIEQDRCAMKVGTDGVLLGAWAEGGRRILDIGTGTGLIALMMAQRFADATVTAIDIDEESCRQARENALASPFADRVEVVHSSLQSYSVDFLEKSLKNDSILPFDSIVSNPPFFEQSLKNPDSRKSMARHADSLPFAELFESASRLLSDDGVFSVIIPSEKLESFTSNAYLSGFYISRQCFVKTTSKKPAKRCLLSFQKHLPEVVEKSEIFLQNSDGTRSESYRNLTKDFYL
ncbi:MAG: methyltransferase [Prevotella sp.]|nr:methyltransferase [Prevotella sp.]